MLMNIIIGVVILGAVLYFRKPFKDYMRGYRLR
jgi:hypothetical protein